MSRYVLGIAAYYHDSSASILEDGEIIAAVQEERFSRKKHDSSFPKQSIQFCLDRAKISIEELESIVFYDKPLLKFDRLLETYLALAPKGLSSFCQSMPIWLKEKLFLKSTLREEFKKNWNLRKDFVFHFAEHHQSHAASAFFPSPFENAAVLCIDGVGEWDTTSAWIGEGRHLKPLWSLQFPHSLGLLYSAFTYFTGFKVNSGEYKLMGLAPYGSPNYVDTIKNHLIDIKADGSFRLNLDYFSYATGLGMTNDRFENLFNLEKRRPESEVRQEDKDLACSIQVVLEEVILKIAENLALETGVENLCLAGGVALNCVANGRLRDEGSFENIWVQPAAGDAGGSLGAAFSYWHQKANQDRNCVKDKMKGALLGPSFTSEVIESELLRLNLLYERPSNFLETVAQLVAKGNIIGWFQGSMEFGPRALGNRSILADARVSDMRDILNSKVKRRESFRPFAPVVIAEDQKEYFSSGREDPYMLFTEKVVENQSLPSVTHVDRSARSQTVHEELNPKFYHLLKEFKKITGCSVMINTSFNVRGEPIVCGVEDAVRCFMNTDIDYLAIGDFLVAKKLQEVELCQKNFPLD